MSGNLTASVAPSKPRIKPHVAPPMDFAKKVMLTSDVREYDPEYILRKMRRHKVDHRSYDPKRFKRTKEILNGLVKQIEPSSNQKVALQKLENLEEFEPAIEQMKQIIKPKSRTVQRSRVKS